MEAQATEVCGQDSGSCAPLSFGLPGKGKSGGDGTNHNNPCPLNSIQLVSGGGGVAEISASNELSPHLTFERPVSQEQL